MAGLGRGLDSLIPNKKITPSNLDKEIDSSLKTLTGQANEQVQEIEVGKIVPNPHQPRSDFDQKELDELTESIKIHGVLQPLIVTQVEDQYQIIAGERRYRAAKSAGLKKVPCIVRDVDEQKKFELALIENVQRQNLNAVETAIAYKKLMDDFNLSQAELAKQIGKSRVAITNTLRILKSPDEVKQAMIKGKISEGHARVIVSLPEEDQLNILNQIISNKMSVRDTEKETKKVMLAKKIGKAKIDPEVMAKEDKLEKYLEAKVNIIKSGGRGKIVITFHTDEELNDVLNKIFK